MAAATKIGSVYVAVGADASDLGKEAGKQITKEMGSAGKSAGSRFVDSFQSFALKSLTTGGKIIGATVGTSIGVAMASSINKGFSRLKNIDAAEARLRGLGLGLQEIEALMGQVDKAVTGTAFGLDEAATAAALLTTSGVQAGEEMESALGAVVTMASSTGAPLQEITGMWQEMAASGVVNNRIIDMLGKRGVNSLALLADHFGISQSAARDMVRDGEVSFELFNQVVQDNLGEMAAEMGSSFEGMRANVGAALGRFGAEVIRPFFEGLKPVMASFIDIMREVTPAVRDFLAPLAPVIQGAFESLAGWISNLDVSGFFESLSSGVSKFSNLILPVGGLLAGSLGPVLTHLPVIGNLFKGLTGPVGLFIGLIIQMFKESEALRGAFGSLFEALGGAIGSLGGVMEPLGNMIAMVAGTLGDMLAEAITVAIPIILTLAEVLGPILGDALEMVAKIFEWLAPLLVKFAPVILGIVAAVKILVPIWKVLSAVMSASPIGLLITAIAALVAGLVWFFTKTETGKKIVETVWSAIKRAVGAVVDWFQNTVQPILSTVWEGIKTGVSAVGDAFSWFYENIVLPVWDGIQTAISVAWEIIKGYFNAIRFVVEDILAPVFIWLWDKIIKPAWDGISTIIGAAWAVVKFIFDTIVAFVKNVLGPIFVNYYEKVIKPVWKGIQKAIEVAWNFIRENIFKPIKAFIDNVLAPVFKWLWHNVISPVWEGIKTAINVVWTFLRDYVFDPLGKFVGETIPNAFTRGKDLAVEAWNKIKSPLETTWNFLKDKIFDPLKKLVKETIPSAFESAKKSIKSAWDGVKSIAAKPVNFLINTVYNDGIRRMWNAVATKFGAPELSRVNSIATFAKGGAVYGPGGPKDDLIPALLSNQEHVWTAEEVRGAGGHGQVQRLRQMAKAGLIPAFAEGGWWARRWNDVKSVASGSWNSIKNAASHLADPIAWIKGGIDKIIGGIGSSGFSSMLRKIPGKVFDALKTKVTDIFAADGGPHAAGLAGPLSPGGWRRPASGRVTSEFGPRWGGFHAGIDLGGTMPTYAARAGRVIATGAGILAGHTGQGILISHGGGYTTYYGHNPFGGIRVRPGQTVEGGQRVGQGGSTGNVTGPHLHFGLMQGGRFINPRTMGVFDGGGWLEPKMLGFNAGKEPEAVLTPLQSRTLTEIANAAHLADSVSRLDRDDLDYLASRISEELWPMARSADMVNDLAALGQNRRRRGSDR